MTIKENSNMILRSALMALILLLIMPLVAYADWYIPTSSEYQRHGGQSAKGPYPTKEICESTYQKFIREAAILVAGPCHGSDSSSGGGFGSQGGNPYIQPYQVDPRWLQQQTDSLFPGGTGKDRADEQDWLEQLGNKKQEGSEVAQ